MVFHYDDGSPSEIRDKDLSNKPYDGAYPPDPDEFFDRAIDWIEVAREMSADKPDMRFPILDAWDNRARTCPSVEVTPLTDTAATRTATGAASVLAKIDEFNMARYLDIVVHLQSASDCDCEFHSVGYLIRQEVKVTQGECDWVIFNRDKVSFKYE